MTAVLALIVAPTLASAPVLAWMADRLAARTADHARALAYVPYWPYETNRRAGELAVTLALPVALVALVALYALVLVAYILVAGTVLGLA